MRSPFRTVGVVGRRLAFLALLGSTASCHREVKTPAVAASEEIDIDILRTPDQAKAAIERDVHTILSMADVSMLPPFVALAIHNTNRDTLRLTINDIEDETLRVAIEDLIDAIAEHPELLNLPLELVQDRLKQASELHHEERRATGHPKARLLQVFGGLNATKTLIASAKADAGEVKRRFVLGIVGQAMEALHDEQKVTEGEQEKDVRAATIHLFKGFVRDKRSLQMNSIAKKM